MLNTAGWGCGECCKAPLDALETATSEAGGLLLQSVGKGNIGGNGGGTFVFLLETSAPEAGELLLQVGSGDSRYGGRDGCRRGCVSSLEDAAPEAGELPPQAPG